MSPQKRWRRSASPILWFCEGVTTATPFMAKPMQGATLLFSYTRKDKEYLAWRRPGKWKRQKGVVTNGIEGGD
jgi:hypothetical protein